MRHFQGPRLFLILLTALTLLVTGCGDSGDDFVAIGQNNNNNNATTGNLIFQFIHPQAVVPATTVTLGFEFFNNTDPELGTLVLETEAVYADNVTVLNVPITARSVVITAYDANEIPVGTLTLGVTVTGGATTSVNLAGAVFTPVTFDSIFIEPNPVNLSLGAVPGGTVQVEIVGSFSNDDEIIFDTATYASNATFLSGNITLATVGTGGLVSAVANGATTLDATYTVNGVTRAAQAPVNVSTFAVTQAEISVPIGGTSAPVTALFNFNGGATTDVTASADITYDSNNGDFDANDDGTVTVDQNALPNETATITATYDNDGVDMVDTFTVTATAP